MYVHRKILVVIQSPDNKELYKFEGLRTLVRITKAGGAYMGTGEVVIYGLTFAHMAELSTYGTAYRPMQHYMMQIYAGDERNGMSMIFYGSVTQAWADFTNMPDIPMYFLISGTTADMNTGTMQPTSWSGYKPIAPLLEKAALAGGMRFEGFGLDGVGLDSGYHWGSPWKQAKEIGDAANVNVVQDDGVLAAWKKTGARDSDTLIVSPKTGLRDYPTFTQFGVCVKVEFRHAIKYGTTMVIQSSFKPANGPWIIMQIDYDLAAEVPKGNWFVILTGVQAGAPVEGLLKS